VAGGDGRDFAARVRLKGGAPSSAMMSGIRSVDSYAKMPCVVFAMLAEPLAVIARDDDQCSSAPTGRTSSRSGASAASVAATSP